MSGGFQQRIRRALSFHGPDHVRFAAQAQVHMTIDQAGDDCEPTAIDALASLWKGNVPAWSNSEDLRSMNEDGGLIENGAGSVDETRVVNGNRHLILRPGR